MQVTSDCQQVAHQLATLSDEELDALSLPAAWFQRSTVEVAQELIGAILVRRDGELLAARIVETEAYLADDPASHSWRGPSERNGAMFAAGGCLYVYRIYGMHRCVNIVTEAEGIGAAVLLRAAEPLVGTATMRRRRGVHVPDAKLLSGPANLARAFGFDLADNYRSCCGDGVWILPAADKPLRIGVSPRIGITRAQERLLRFFDPTSPAVSSHRRAAQLIEVSRLRQLG